MAGFWVVSYAWRVRTFLAWLACLGYHSRELPRGLGRPTTRYWAALPTTGGFHAMQSGHIQGSVALIPEPHGVNGGARLRSTTGSEGVRFLPGEFVRVRGGFLKTGLEWCPYAGPAYAA